MTELSPDHLARALEGDLQALRQLIDSLAPVVRARVARALSRYPHAYNPEEVEDLTQEVFVSLFAANAKLLRKWDPERGLSLRNFVGLLAQHRVAELLRGRHRPARRDTVSLDDSQLRIAQPDASEDGEARSTSHDLLARLLTHLEATLSERGLELFVRLYIHHEPISEICQDTGLSAEAVYQWRSRLAKAARDGLRALETAPMNEQPGQRKNSARAKGRGQ
jgi:RNA polymerase sigma factor (sigma-70 family)